MVAYYGQYIYDPLPSGAESYADSGPWLKTMEETVF